MKDGLGDPSRGQGPAGASSGHRPTAIELSEKEVVMDAAIVAEKLGLPTSVFWQELRRGAIYGVVERGEGADKGKLRLTFRYGLRSWMVVLDGTVQ